LTTGAPRSWSPGTACHCWVACLTDSISALKAEGVETVSSGNTAGA
jgi:hypothetical protein